MTEEFAEQLRTKLHEAIDAQPDTQTILVMMPEAPCSLSSNFKLLGKTVVLICGRDSEL